MFVHIDHLVPGMELESDVRLQAGSFLLTRKDLPDARLNEKVIESIHKFGNQLAPVTNKISIKDDELTIRHLKSILEEDVAKVINVIISKEEGYPNFISDTSLKEKLIHLMNKLISKPDIIKYLYEFKITEDTQFITQLTEHSIRVTMLSMALGLKLKCSIISIMNLGISAIFHDMGLLKMEIYPDLAKLDDFTPGELEKFAMDHQKISSEIFKKMNLELLPSTTMEITHIIGCHHRPDFEDQKDKLAQIFYFAELVDEMLCPMPYKVRYNFTSEEIITIGQKFARRQGLVNILLALLRLSKGRDYPGKIVEALLELFSLEELLLDGYEEKLRKIVESSIHKCAVAYPSISGNSLPRTIYCNDSLNPEFSCINLGQARIEIYVGSGKFKSYKKCDALTNRLHDLNKAGREKARQKKAEKNEIKKDQDIEQGKEEKISQDQK